MGKIKTNNGFGQVCEKCYLEYFRPRRQCVECARIDIIIKKIGGGGLCSVCYSAQPEQIARRFEASCKRKSKDSGHLSPSEWLELMKEFEWKCFYCETSLSGRDGNRTIDHIIPIAKNGKTQLENLIPACRSCNGKKGVKVFEQWANEIKLSSTKVQHILKRLGKLSSG